MYPISDADGELLEGNDFTIKNIGNLDYRFDIKIVMTSDTNPINLKYVKIKVDNGDILTLDSISNNIIRSNIILKSGESIKVNVKTWLSIDTPNAEMGKTFSYKVVFDGEAVYTSSNNKLTAAATIVSLYQNSIKTSVINNNITYQYDTTHNLMQDIGGNVRYYGKSNVTIVPAWQSSDTELLLEKSFSSEESCLEELETNWNACSPNVDGYDSYGYDDQATCEAEFDWGGEWLGLAESLTYNDGKKKYCTGTGKKYETLEINNYIYFNCDDYSNQTDTTCEKWRIIGVFDGNIKIMRGSTIGSYSWDNKNKSTGAEADGGKNDWTTARLMKLLNPSNYYTIDSNDNGYGQSLYWNGESGTCFSGANNETTACDFTNIGLKNDITRNIIEETIYSLKGYYSNNVFPNVLYDKERISGTVYSGRPTSLKEKIAIPYASDYIYATDLSLCQETPSDYYINSACVYNNWIKLIITNNSSNRGWLLTSNSSSSVYVWYVDKVGYVNSGYNTYYAYDIAPVLSLNPELEIKSGDGSSSNPYQLIP